MAFFFLLGGGSVFFVYGILKWFLHEDNGRMALILCNVDWIMDNNRQW
jgi:hypothetical protein